MRGLFVYELDRYTGGSRFIDQMHDALSHFDDIQLVMKEDVAITVNGNDVALILPDGTRIEKGGERPDWVMLRTDDWEYALAFETIGIPCFPPSRYSRFADNKSACHILLSKVVPSPTTLVKKGTLDADTFDVPYIMKGVSGHGGAEVKKIEKPFDGASLADEFDAKKVPYLCQEIAKAPDDLRVYVIGREILASVLRRPTDGGYRANISLGGEAIEYKLSDEQRAVVEDIINVFDCELGFVCFDFLFGDDGALVFNEMNNLPGTAALGELGLDGGLMDRYIEYMDCVAPKVAEQLAVKGTASVL